MTWRITLGLLLVGLIGGCDATLDVAPSASLPVAADLDPVALGAPIVYVDRFRQAPVRGGPGDLLLIAGDGFDLQDVVVYQRMVDTTAPPPHPSSIPTESTAESGTAPVIRHSPDALTVRLPELMIAGQSYALWVARPMDSALFWSATLRINDARPLWVTPSFLYRTATVPGLPRELKVVGRNLDPAPSAITRVRLRPVRQLTGEITLAAAVEPVAELNEVVARVKLPATLAVGDYNIDVSRDGVSWENVFRDYRVRRDPIAPPVHVVGNPCLPDDGESDTSCIQNAIDAAKDAGGVVFFPSGTWNLEPTDGLDPANGIVVPQGVSLRGDGPMSTRLVRSTEWTARVVFTLQGANRVERLRFVDPAAYTSSSPPNIFIQLGKVPWASSEGDPSTVEDVVLSGNVFDRPYWAIADGNLPIHRLFVTDNEFGAFHSSLFLFGPVNVIGPAGLPLPKFRVVDSVIAHNRFYPGAFQNRTTFDGVIASHLGASTRVDVSNNIIDGRDTRYLGSDDAKGFRAGLFFNTNNNHEMLLISRNTMSCTGDKGGDGEAIAFDTYKNRVAFKEVKPVRAARASGVSVYGPADIIVPNDYYSEHWVVVMDGKGAGQARKVTRHSLPMAPIMTFEVDPPWDVVPDPESSMVSVGRNYWQVLTVANDIDIRGCVKPPQAAFEGRSKSGEIMLFTTMTDSAVLGNVQHESDGITIAGNYWLDAPHQIDHQAKYFVEVRGNTIDDEFDYCSTWSRSGVRLIYNVSPKARPPRLGFGITIANNLIRRADGDRGGAIDFAFQTWPLPVAPYFVDTLVFDNDIRDIAIEPGLCSPHARIGIHIQSANLPPATPDIRDTTLSGNIFTNVNARLYDYGAGTIDLP